MLKMRTRAESKAAPRLALTWDDDQDNQEKETPTVLPLATASATKAPSAPDTALPSESAPVSVTAEKTEPQELEDNDSPTSEMAEEPTPLDNDAPEGLTKLTDKEQDRPAAMPSSNATGVPAKPGHPKASEPVILNIDDDEPLGDILTSLRAKAGFTIKDVHDKTRIPITCIKALEQSNYEELPQLTICYAYLERLCNEYDINPDALQLKLEHEYILVNGSPENKPPLKPQDTGKHLPPASLPGILIALLLLLLIVFIIGGVLKLAFKKEVERPKIDLPRMIVPKPQPIQTLAIPENK